MQHSRGHTEKAGAPADYRAYIQAWQQRARRQQAERRRAVEKALSEARAIAAMLVEQFGVEKVWLFGSLARALTRPEAFHEHSDIDLAVERVEGIAYFRAIGEALKLTHRSVQIVELATCPETLAEKVHAEGILLYGPAGSDASHPV